MRLTVVFHPFIFAIFTVLGIYARNSVDIPVQWVGRPLFVSLLFAIVLFYILRAKTRDAQYAGLATTLGLFWFYFGHFQRALFEESPFWDTFSGKLLAFTMWTLPLGFLASQWAWKHISNRTLVTKILNIASVIVILIPAYVTLNTFIQTIKQSKLDEDRQSSGLSVALEKQVVQPDIYLIILDAYGREDYLREVYGMDNSEFIGYLKEKGFYVADASTANYPQTLLSLSSLLNMSYLDELTKDFRNTDARGPVVDLVQHSQVRQSLKSIGYDYVALPSATLSTQTRDADLYIDMTVGDVNEFEGLLLSSTIANLAIDALDLNIPVPSYGLHRRYILFSLNTLATMPEIAGPKFVFSHIMAPHPPFVLDEQGNAIQSDRPFNTGDASGFMGTREEYIAGYADEIHYLNQRLMGVIDTLLEQSSTPPIIIIQGDHGPGAYYDMLKLNDSCLTERYSILNAYHFPDGDYQLLYPAITPVNSFRVILDKFFGTNLDLIDDKNYFAGWLSPYRFTDVTAKVDLTCNISAVQSP